MWNGNRYDYIRYTKTEKRIDETITMLVSVDDDIIANIKEAVERHEYGDKVGLNNLAEIYLVGSGYCVCESQKELTDNWDVSIVLSGFRDFRYNWNHKSLKACCDNLDTLFDSLGLPYSANNGRVKDLASHLGKYQSRKRTTGNIDSILKDDRAFYVEVAKWLYSTFQCKYTAETTYKEVYHEPEKRENKEESETE